MQVAAEGGDLAFAVRSLKNSLSARGSADLHHDHERRTILNGRLIHHIA
jgi:hypothetical protein